MSPTLVATVPRHRRMGAIAAAAVLIALTSQTAAWQLAGAAAGRVSSSTAAPAAHWTGPASMYYIVKPSRPSVATTAAASQSPQWYDAIAGMFYILRDTVRHPTPAPPQSSPIWAGPADMMYIVRGT